ncbi:M16 family metallopeptidase [Sphingomonas jaspsi]|uniref:M16 family metallopeptidase n=1 Tax=Sphingomonas jaspsi TaxID=392409 RepID=UPI0004B6315D|nr:insulinase family protein [Sphingomonas jaspsi]
MARARSCRHLLAAVAALAIAIPAAAEAQSANGWGIATTDVPADPSIKLGRLPNGMRYAIMRNATPKGAAVVRLRFEFGSLAEAENERGLAHFIEHMAFNGSTHVAEGDMVKILERQGLAFGPDTNASTGFDNTTYMLDLPEADAARVDTALFLLRETASEVSFAPAAVDRERGVILGERRSRDGFQLRQIVDQLGFIAPQAPYANRLPIGTEEVLKTAPAERIKALYRRYYRPENATLVFVGDADPAEIEAKIKAKFADWKGVGPAGAPLPFGKVDHARALSIDTFVDPAVPTRAQLAVTRPWDNPADTQADRRRKLVEGVANAIFSKRLTRIVNAPASPFITAFSSNQDLENAALVSSLAIIAKDGDWSQALATAEQEIRRAKEFGFTQAELTRQIAEAGTAVRTQAEQANSRESAALADAILNTVGEPDFVTTPAWRLENFNRIAPTVTLDEVNAAFRRLWTGSQPLIHISDKATIEPATIAAQFAASQKVAVAKPAAESALAFAYDSFGPAGTVVEDKRIADLGIRTIRFANNVRLNIRKTDFEAGKVRYSVRMDGGLLALPADKPGLGFELTVLSAIGGTSKHSLEELRTLMAGKVVSPGVALGDDAIVAAGQTTAADLGTQLKVSAAYMIDPGFRPEAASQWANIVPVIDKQLRSQAQSVLQTKANALLTNDWRVGIPDSSVLAARNLGEAKAALAPIVATAPIEIGIVGDIDEDKAFAAVAQSFGALPARAAAEPDYSAARKLSFRADKAPIELTHDGPADQAISASFWPTTDDRNYREEAGMNMLAQVLELMLTDSVREKLGASYGVSVTSAMSDVFDGYGTFSVATVVAPDRIGEVEKAVIDAVKQLRARPAADDLLLRARNPLLEQIAKTDRENGTWMTFVAQAQSEADRLDRFRTRKQVYQALTGKELQALAVKYLDPAKVRLVHVRSTAK